MRFTDFLRHLASDEIAPVYLFRGDANLLMDEAWQKLVQKIVPVKARRLNGERLQAKEHSANEVLERVKTLPMFGAKQLVMVQNIDVWSKDQQQSLLAYLEKPQPSACLVLTTCQKKGVERLESAIDSTGMVVAFPAPNERDAPRWLQERARIHNKKMSLDAAGLLFEQVGLDLYRLELELNKLLQYVGERETITLDDVAEAVSSQRSFSVFELLDHIGQGEKHQAINSLRNLVRAGEAPLAILALMSRQLRLLWQARDGLERGIPVTELTRQLRLPQTVTRKYVHQSKAFSTREFRQFHSAIRDADVALKSSGTNPEWILEDLVLKLVGGSKRSQA